jgi:hypothetical protein
MFICFYKFVLVTPASGTETVNSVPESSGVFVFIFCTKIPPACIENRF